MRVRISIFFSCILLVAGCMGLKHQTGESEPHALVVIAPDSGLSEKPVVIKIDGRKVKPGAEYRITPGEHEVIVLTMVQIGETFETSRIIGIGDAGESAATLTIPQSGDPELSGTTSSSLGSVSQPVNLRYEGWIASYITNSILFEAGWRYVLDGEQVGKIKLPRGTDANRDVENESLNERDEKGFTQLNRAAYNGDVTMAKWLLDAGADPDIADNEGFTPLHTAVEQEHVGVAEVLLAYHADPNITCPGGTSPLHQAAGRNDLAAMSMLLDAGAAVDAVCPGGTPLAYAAQANKIEAVRVLLAHGASLEAAYDKSGLTPLHFAALFGHGEIAEILVDAGADINNMSPYHGTPLHAASIGRQGAKHIVQKSLSKMGSADTKVFGPIVGSEDDYAVLWDVLLAAEPNFELREPKYGRTALGNAVNQGSETAVVALHQAGADVNAASRYGHTPLHEAATMKATSTVVSNIVAHLIDAGADIEARDKAGGTPLHAAANAGQPIMIRLLLSAGAQVNSIGPNRCTPIQLAVLKRDEACVRLLLDAGADVNVPNAAGSTALHQAAGMQERGIVRTLLESGADPDADALYGTTALIISADSGDVETMKLLLDHGAEVNSVNKQGVTALLAAAAKGELEAARLLIDRGAKHGAMVKGASSPLTQAARNGHAEVVKFLLETGASTDDANEFGFTALHEAADRAHPEVAGLLLDHGADPNSRDKYRAAPLSVSANGMFAEESRYVAVIRVLLDHGANINAQRDNGQTAMHRTAVWGRPEIMQALMDAGADLTVRDADGKTALDIASDSFNPQLRRDVAAGRKACEKLLRKAIMH